MNMNDRFIRFKGWILMKVTYDIWIMKASFSDSSLLSIFFQSWHSSHILWAQLIILYGFYIQGDFFTVPCKKTRDILTRIGNQFSGHIIFDRNFSSHLLNDPKIIPIFCNLLDLYLIIFKTQLNNDVFY